MQPGQRVGAYIIEAHGGSGGMAEVYRARHAALGSVHALKILRPELAASEEIRQRFLAEGRVQAQVRHDHIVRVTDLVAEAGVAALVLEWLGGGSLEDRLMAQPGEALTVDEVRGILLPILDALAVLHEQGIVHRDIKPANLLFPSQGWEGVRLTDFGIARVGDEVRGGRRHTRAGTRLGTPQYMSPEQVRSQAVDARSDLFSLGVMAWELLTGALPFEGDNDFATMKAIVEAPRVPLVQPGVSRSLALAIEGALAVDPEGRWPSAEVFSERLSAGCLAEPEPADVEIGEAEIPVAPTDEVPLELSLEPEPAEPRVGRSWGGSCLGLVVVAGLAAGATLGALNLFFVPQQQNKAQDHVAAAWAELQTYKTDAAANRDDTHLLRASAHASRGVEAWSTSEALGMRALVFGWEQGWQLRAGRWDPVAHGSLQVAIDQADAEGLSAEAAAARVWLELGACRFHPDPGDRSAACVRLGKAADRAVPLLAARPWMAVEVDWVASLGARSLAEDNLASGRALKIPYTRDTLRRCARGLGSVDAAPINGRYLWQNCVRLAGWAEDVPRFLRWGDAMVQHGRARGYKDEELLPALFVGAAPACTSMDITTRKGRPTTWDGRGTGGWGDLCVLLGRVAMGCDNEAFDARPVRCPQRLWWQPPAVCEPLQAPRVPWNSAIKAVFSTRADRGATCRW